MIEVKMIVCGGKVHWARARQQPSDYRMVLYYKMPWYEGPTGKYTALMCYTCYKP